jgi:hypothetical protein
LYILFCSNKIEWHHICDVAVKEVNLAGIKGIRNENNTYFLFFKRDFAVFFLCVYETVC